MDIVESWKKIPRLQELWDIFFYFVNKCEGNFFGNIIGYGYLVVISNLVPFAIIGNLISTSNGGINIDYNHRRLASAFCGLIHQCRR